MKKNVGSIDRVIRLIVVIVIAVLLYTETVAISSTLGIILAVAGVIFLFTSAVSWCAIYQIVGLNSCPLESARE